MGYDKLFKIHIVGYKLIKNRYKNWLFFLKCIHNFVSFCSNGLEPHYY